MQHAAHLALERLIHQLMLLHPRLALERWRDDRRGIMITIAGEIPDRDLSIWNVCLDQALNFDGIHRHRQVLANLKPLRPYRPEAMIQTVPAESRLGWDARRQPSTCHRRSFRLPRPGRSLPSPAPERRPLYWPAP